MWFDGSIKGLSAASFGLDKGNAVAQESTITLTNDGRTDDDTVSVSINGVDISAVTDSADDEAATLKLLYDAITDAIELDAASALGDQKLQNISLELMPDANTPTSLKIKSSVAGTSFTLSGAKTDTQDGTLGIELKNTIPNSVGNNDMTAIMNATAQSTEANTLYGTVRMISDPALLPLGMPSPIGAPPSDQLAMAKASGKPFTVSAGINGFSEVGSFAALGFQTGTFGGRSSEDLDPPRVGRLAFQVGAGSKQLITIDLADFGKGGPITGEITGDVDLNVEQRSTRINTREGASSVLALLDSSMEKVNATRATMGAIMNRLDHVISNLTNVSMNLSASRSSIEDADYAAASTELAKTQIMQQAATAVLAQANTSQQSVLKLLGG
jgi:flagellin